MRQRHERIPARRSIRWASLGLLALLSSLLVACSLRTPNLRDDALSFVHREAYDYDYDYPEDDTTADRDGSALVSLAGISAKEREFRPGVYRYGQGYGEALILTGVSVAGDYHSPGRLWLHVFALGDRVVNGKKCSFDERRVNSTVSLELWKEMEE